MYIKLSGMHFDSAWTTFQICNLWIKITFEAAFHFCTEAIFRVVFDKNNSPVVENISFRNNFSGEDTGRPQYVPDYPCLHKIKIFTHFVKFAV